MGWNEILDLLVLFELSIIASVVVYNLIVYNALYFWSTVSIAFQYLYRDLLVEFPRATNYDAVSQFFFSDGMRAIELAIGIALLAVDHFDLAHKVKRELERETSVLLQEVVMSTAAANATVTVIVNNEQPPSPDTPDNDVEKGKAK